MNEVHSSTRSAETQRKKKRRRRLPWRSILLLLALANLIIPLALFVSFQRQVQHLDEMNRQLAGQVASLQQALAAVESDYAGRAELATLQADLRRQTMALDRVMHNQQLLAAEIGAGVGTPRLLRSAAELNQPPPPSVPSTPTGIERLEAAGRATIWGTVAAGATYYGGKLLHVLTQVARLHPAIP